MIILAVTPNKTWHIPIVTPHYKASLSFQGTISFLLSRFQIYFMLQFSFKIKLFVNVTNFVCNKIKI